MKRSFGNMRLGGRYRLSDRIAFGGMGEVWRALDEVLGRKVAVKILRPELAYDDSFRRRFRAEARTAGALSHPGIAAVYDYGEGPVLPAEGPAQPITPSTPGNGALTGDEVAYLVMELVPGEPLSAMLSRGALNVDATLDIVAQSARALHAAHERGVVHRDVKPANLLVTPDGVVKVTDFGIARPRDHEPLTMTGQVMGTAHYLAPELARGREATPLSDVYALGVVMYECLAGRRPFEGDNQVAVATAHLAEPPPPLPETLPEDVRELVDMAMEKDVEHRIRSAADFAHELEVVLRKRRRPQRAPGEPGGRGMRREIDLRDDPSGGGAVRTAAAGAAGAGAAAAAAGAAAAPEAFTEHGAGPAFAPGYEQAWGYDGDGGQAPNGYNGYASGYQNGYANGYGNGYDPDGTEVYGDYGRAAAGLAGAGYGADGPPTPTDDLGLARNGGSHRDRDRRVVPFALTWQTGLLALAVLLVLVGVFWVAALLMGPGKTGSGSGTVPTTSSESPSVSPTGTSVKTTGPTSSGPATSRPSRRTTSKTTRATTSPSGTGSGTTSPTTSPTVSPTDSPTVTPTDTNTGTVTDSPTTSAPAAGAAGPGTVTP